MRPRTVSALDGRGFIVSPEHLRAILYAETPGALAHSWSDQDTVPDVHVWDDRLRDAREATFLLPSDTAMSVAKSVPDADLVARSRLVVEFLEYTPPMEQRMGWLRGSPYLAVARRRIAGAVEQLRHLAEQYPLVLMDVQFETGHGAAVQQAATQLLSDLGAATLAEHVLTYDILPRPAEGEHARTLRDENSDLVTVYDAYTRGYGISQNEKNDALAWLGFPSLVDRRFALEIPPSIMQAMVWSQLTKGRWLNMSWAARPMESVFPPRWADLVTDSFVSVAAGNTNGPLPPERNPQQLASRSRHFANVTYGSADGVAIGTTTNESGPRVDLMALSDSRSTVHGSSYASSLVAAAAWLKHLLDGTDAADMRHELLRASSLVALNGGDTRAHGVLDPARLIANPGAHYVSARDGSIEKLSGTVALDVRASGCIDKTRVARSDRQGVLEVVVYPDRERYFLLQRLVPLQGGDVTVYGPCLVENIALSVTTSDEMVLLEIGSPQEFHATIRSLHY